jgi:tRNA(fMet)-specific endonuclease VapC
MRKYLLDTNIIVFLFKKRFEMNEKIKKAGIENCAISEVSVAELHFGVECSPIDVIEEKRARLNSFLERIQIIPFSTATQLYAKEKARLTKLGELISDFDILIGSTAVANDFVLVTNNTKHISRIQNIEIEDWTKSYSVT